MSKSLLRSPGWVVLLLAALWAAPARASVVGTRPSKLRAFRLFGDGVPIGNTMMGTEFAAPQVNTRLLASSTATLTGLPPDAVVSGAYLMWAGSLGNASTGGPFVPDTMVSLRVADGSFFAVPADGACLTIGIYDGFYKCRADVTDLIAAHPGVSRYNGDYTVSDLAAQPGHIDVMNPPACAPFDPFCQSKFASWTLIVVYSSASAPLQRDIHIYDGFQSFDEQQSPMFSSGIDSFAIDGFLVASPPVGEVSYWGMEGDALLGTPPQDTSDIFPCDTCFDFFQYNATKLFDLGTNNQAGNLFNSSTALGLDIDTFKIGSQPGGLGLLSVGDTAARITVGSGDDIPGPADGSGGGEFVVLGWTLLRLNRPAPSFRTVDTFKDVDPAEAAAGETLFYTVQITNAGSADATAVRLVDRLPAEAVYVAGSTRIDGVACTDAADGDACAVSGGALTVSFAALPFTPPGNKRKVTFRARVAAGVPNGATVCNSATVTAAETGDVTTIGPACITTAAPVIGTPSKSFQDVNGGVLAPDDLVQFTIAIPASRPAGGLSFVDDIPAHMHLVSVAPPAGASDRSTLTGGANGTGRVDIDGIAVPDGAPASFSFIVRVSSVAQFVAAGVPSDRINGTSVCNQGRVGAAFLPAPKPTDDPTTGPSPDATCRSVTYSPGFSTSRKVVVDTNGGNAIPGDTLVYTLDVVNTGATAAAVDLSDPLPPGVTGFVPLVLPPGSTFFPPPAGANGTGLLTVTGTTVNPGQTLQVRFQVTIDPAAPDGLVIQNTAQMNVPMFPSEGRALASQALTVFSRPDVSATTKTVIDVNGGDAQPGDLVRYTITVPNAGNKDASGVTVTDVVDANLTGVTPLDGGTFDAASRTIAWNVGVIAAGSTVTLRFEARIATPLATGTVVANQARVTSANTPAELSDDPATGAVDDPTRLAVVSAPDYRATTKVVADLNGGLVEPGDVLRYTIVVRNTGTAVGTRVVVNDGVDATLVGVVPGSGGVFSGGVIIWNLGDVAPGDAVTLTFDATVRTPLANGTRISNQAFVRGAEGPAAPGAPSDDPSTPAPGDPTVVTVSSRALLGRSIKVARDENAGVPQPGDVLTYEIAVKNDGNSPARQVVITDALPPQLTLVEALDGGAYDPGARVVTWMRAAEVVPGVDGLVRFRASIAAPLANGTVVCNQAAVASPDAPGPPAPTDDPATAAAGDPTCVTVTSRPELVASIKTVTDDNGGVVAPGDALTYVVTVRNTGTESASAVRVTDVVSGFLTAVTPLDGGVFDPGARTITWTVASVAAKTDVPLRFSAQVVRPLDDGTLISNQAQITSNELLGPFFTDDPTTPDAGDPTVLRVSSRVRFSSSTKVVVDPNGGRLEPGDALTYTITVTNDGGSLARAVTVTDVIDTARLTAIVPDQGGVFDAASGAIVWSPAGTPALATVGLDAAGAVTLGFSARLATPLNNATLVCNQASIRSSEVATPTLTDDPRTPVAQDATCGTVSSAADFSNASKTVDDPNGAPLRPGDTVAYTLSFTNTGNAAATGVVVTDPVDPSLEAVAPGQGGVLAGAAIRWDGATTPSLARVAPGQTVTLSFTARVRRPLDGGTVVSNQATIAADGMAPAVTDDPSTAAKPDPTRVTVVSEANLANLTKTVADSNGAPLRPGDTVTYTIRLANSGDAVARDVAVTDVVDPNLDGIVVLDGGRYDAATRTVSWLVPVVGLAPGGDVILRFQARVRTPLANGTVVSNQARASSPSVPEPILSDDPGTAATDDPTNLTVVAAPSLATSTKTVAGDRGGQAGPGVLLSYTLTVVNNGDDTARGAQVTDRVDDTLDAVAPMDGGLFDAGSRLITWNVGDLPPGGRAVARFSARVRDDARNGAVIRNQGFIAATGLPAPVPTDDPRNGVGDANSTDVTVSAVPRLTLTKRISDVNGGTTAPGDAIKYLLTLTNTGAAFAHDVTVTDPVDQANLVSVVASAGGVVGGPGGPGVVWNPSTTPALARIAPGATVTLEIDAAVRAPTANGTVVSNQAAATPAGLTALLSDDPTTPAPGDPTRFTVVSVPDLSESPKTVRDLNGGVVAPGDELEYTIRVTNRGTDVAPGTRLIDPIPGSTALVPGSLTLNGAPQPDALLATGVTVQSPGAAPGILDVGPAAAAIVAFRVRVAAAAIAGTVISNQGLVFAEGLSLVGTDDPRTPARGDPTQVVVGGGPLLRSVTKTYSPRPVGGGDAVFDIGEGIDYRVVVTNTGDGVARDVVFRDALPAATAVYAPGTLSLSGVRLTDAADADAGQIAGGVITVRLGNLLGGQQAEIAFQARIVAGPAVINQGSLESRDTPFEATDADDNDGNGNQPTVTPVGPGRSAFTASKAVYDLDGGQVDPGDVLLYTVAVSNISPMSRLGVDFADDVPGLTRFVEGSIIAASPRIAYDRPPAGRAMRGRIGVNELPIAAGATSSVTFRVNVDGDAACGRSICNVGEVRVTPTEFTPTLTDPACVITCSDPSTGGLAGVVFEDVGARDHRLAAGVDLVLPDFVVQAYPAHRAQGDPVGTAISGADGKYQILGLPPGPYRVRVMSSKSVLFTDVVTPDVRAGTITTRDLPVDPSGRVYDATSGALIQDARAFLYYAPDDPEEKDKLVPEERMGLGQQGQRTNAFGMYHFDVQPRRKYRLVFEPPGVGAAFPSTIIPPLPGFAQTDDAGNVVPAHVPDPKKPDFRPDYYLQLDVKDASSPVFHNHVPLDALADVVRLEKRVDRRQATIGEPLTYTVTVRNRSSRNLTAAAGSPVRIEDVMPAGLRLLTKADPINGRAQAAFKLFREAPDGTRTSVSPPVAATTDGGRVTRFGEFDLPAGDTVVLAYQAVVGLDAREGNYENEAVLLGPADIQVSNRDRALVRVMNDPEFDHGFLLGRVFCDVDGDGAAGKGDRGVLGARVYLDTGYYASTDLDGKLHLKDIPPGVHLIKLDMATTPPGSQALADESRVVLFTRGMPAQVWFPLRCGGETVGPGKVELAKQAKPSRPVPKLVRVSGSVREFRATVGEIPLPVGSVDLAITVAGAPPPAHLAGAAAPNFAWPRVPAAGGIGMAFHHQTDVKDVRAHTLRIERVDLAGGAGGGAREPVYVRRGAGAPPAAHEWDGRQGGELVVESGGLYAVKLILASESGTVTESAWRRFGVAYGAAAVGPVTAPVGAAKEPSTNPSPSEQILRGDLFRGSTPTPELKRELAAAAKSVPPVGSRITIEAHTDDGGPPAREKATSQAQADAARALLTEALGVAASTIEARGLGRSRPLVPGITPSIRRKNRRLVIRVTPPAAAPEAPLVPVDLPGLPDGDDRVFIGPMAATLGDGERFSEDVEVPASGRLTVDMLRRDGRRVVVTVPVGSAPPSASPPVPVSRQRLRVEGDLSLPRIAVAGRLLDVRLLQVTAAFTGAIPRGGRHDGITAEMELEPARVKGQPTRLEAPLTLAFGVPPASGAAKAAVTGWTVLVRRADGTPVFQTGGEGPPPATWSWRGEDGTGVPLLEPGVAYALKLIVRTAGGDRGQSRELRLTTRVTSPAGGGAAFTFRAQAPGLFKPDGKPTRELTAQLARLGGQMKRRPAGETYHVDLLVRGKRGRPADEKRRRLAAADAVKQALAALDVPARSVSVQAMQAPPLGRNETFRLIAAPTAREGGASASAAEASSGSALAALPFQVVIDGRRAPVSAQGAFATDVDVAGGAGIVIDVQDAGGGRAVLFTDLTEIEAMVLESFERSAPLLPDALSPTAVPPPPAPAPPSSNPTPAPTFKPAPPAPPLPRSQILTPPLLRGGAWRDTSPGAVFALAQAGAPGSAERVADDLRRALEVPAVPSASPPRPAAPVPAAQLAVTLPPRGLPLRSERLEVRGRTDPTNTITINGRPATVAPDGVFAELVVLPFGPSTIEIRSRDAAGNVAIIAWPVEVSDKQLFVMALADGAVASARANGTWTADGAEVDGMTEATTARAGSALFHGRGALYLKGRMKGDKLFKQYVFTAHVDTAKRPELEAFYDQIVDPNRYYPVYGDTADEIQDVRSRGKLYVLVEADDSKLRIGNFRSALKGIDLFTFDRAVWGAEIDFRKSWASSSAVKDRAGVETRAFVSKDDARLVRDHNVLRATGGSIYYLRHGQLIPGGERVRLVTRDRTSGLPLLETPLVRDSDYVIDYLGGRVVMKAPVPSYAEPGTLTNPASSFAPGGGHPVYVEVDYDYEADEPVTGATLGGVARGTWGGLTVGAGVAQEGRGEGRGGGQGTDAGPDYRVFGFFGEYRAGTHTRVTAELARSQAADARNFISEDGGLTYLSMNGTALASTDPRAGERNAYKLDLQSDLSAALGRGAPGTVTGHTYFARVDRGFFGNGLILEQGRTKYGVELSWKMTGRDRLVVRHDGVLAELPELPAYRPAGTGTGAAAPATPFRFRTIQTETLVLRYLATRGAAGFDAQLAHQYQGGYANSGGSPSASPPGSNSTTRDFVAAGFRYKLSDRLTIRAGQEILLWASGGDLQYEPSRSEGPRVMISRNLGDRFTTTAGVDLALTRDLTLSGTEAVRWSGSTSTMLGLKAKLSPTASFYVRERLEDRNGGLVSTSIVGAEDQLKGTANGRVYGEYQLDHGQSGERNRAILGITNKWRVTPGFSLNGSLEHQQIFGARLPDGTPLGDQARAVVSLGHEWLRLRRLKLSGRIEFRYDDADGGATPAVVPGQVAPGGAGAVTPLNDPRTSRPGDLGYADRTPLPGSQGVLSPGDKLQYLLSETVEWSWRRALSLFGRINFSETRNLSLCNRPGGASVPGSGATCSAGVAIEARFIEATAGFAWRPTESDWLTTLGRYSYIMDARPLASYAGAAVERTSHVLSLTPIVELPFRLQLVEKLAFKQEQSFFGLTTTEGFDTTTRTLLLINRLNYHLARAWDAGIEYRLMRLYLPGGADQLRTGSLLEVGYWVNPHTRLGAGWNFSRFSDNELADLDRDTYGFFVRVVGKY